jgi:hypothetical protein
VIPCPITILFSTYTTNQNSLKQGPVYEVKRKNKIGHLFCMDKLKLSARVQTKLQQEFTIFQTISDCIRMELGLHICARGIYKYGKLTKSKILVQVTRQ